MSAKLPEVYKPTNTFGINPRADYGLKHFTPGLMKFVAFGSAACLLPVVLWKSWFRVLGSIHAKPSSVPSQLVYGDEE